MHLKNILTASMSERWVTVELALLLIEEGLAIRAGQDIYQRNPTIHYFDFRKWRKTDAYTNSREIRNKVYRVSGPNAEVFTREQVTDYLQQLDPSTLLQVVPPKGYWYTQAQLKKIYKDIHRLSDILSKFL
jgi:hypothetical protein